ncbi:MAG: HEPN domain-containing protein [Candidatus Glassbacteria bacterium]|nr:HEPN domain-containing protein [Candidatus Glassbacteria bacterium]
MKEMFIDLAKYRIQRAFENRTDAILLLKSERINESVNRLYQANYYAVKSLLATRMKDSTKQQRVLHIFQEQFIQTGEIPTEYGQIVDRSYRSRDERERRDQLKLSRQEAESMIGESERFICFVRDYLQQLILASPEKSTGPLKEDERSKEHAKNHDKDR